MKLLLIADGRSPITRRWIHMLLPLGFELILISSYPCEPIWGIKRQYLLPLAFATQGGTQAGSVDSGIKRKLVSRFRPFAQTLRHHFGPWLVTTKSNQYRAIVQDEKPDLVHALRIPFEGMLSSFTPKGIPVVVSTWGNDFTFHAPSTTRMSAMTGRTLQRASALISDTLRDERLAHDWGLDKAKPTLSVPGNGGLDIKEITNITKGIVKADPPLVINPRGFRPGSVRNDTFFKAIPLVLAKYPQVVFTCAFMAGQIEALDWIRKLGIEKNIRLLPFISQTDLWKEFAQSQVSLSISQHDGTPNSLLEAMAVGCLPICGDIESIRQWITDGENGRLVDPSDPHALAKTILECLDNPIFQQKAAQKNLALIQQKADIEITREKVKKFYDRFV